jgi:SAM-dependent methyltransferase
LQHQGKLKVNLDIITILPRILFIVGGMLVVFFFIFLDWQIFLLLITAIGLSILATLVTMSALGFPLSRFFLLPASLMVGLGLVQGFFVIRFFQRRRPSPSLGFKPIRVMVLVGCISVLIGFGFLIFFEQTLFPDNKVFTLLGFLFVTAVTCGIMPPVLRHLFSNSPIAFTPVQIGSKQHLRMALRRFRHLEPYPRLFARFKILTDPMFPRLIDFVRPGWKVIDVGCGYGAPAAWLLAAYPDLKFLSCDPNRERTRVAARILGQQGEVLTCTAQDLPLENKKADAILLLDILHYLSDQELLKFLDRSRPVLRPEGRLIIRATIPRGGFSLLRFVEETKLRFKGVKYHFRKREQCTRILKDTGFKEELVERTIPHREEIWFIARVDN